MFWTNYTRLCGLVGKAPNTVAREAGISSGSVTGWKNGKMPHQAALKKLANYFGVGIAELIGEETQTSLGSLPAMYLALDEHGRKIVEFVLKEEYARCTAAEEIPMIRHYLYSPAAGPNGLVSGEDYEDIPRPSDAPEDADYCLTVSGDSMEPYIHDGQLVYVKEDAHIWNLDVGVFFVDGATYVKQYARSYDGGAYLLSANPERESENLTICASSTSSLVCLGKVILPKRLPMPIYR